MTNPIHLPSPDGAPYNGPLLLFDERVDHLPLFAFIDGMRELYDMFDASVTNERLRTRGHLILVHGPPGVGKSTFIQRCAYLLAHERSLERATVFHYGQSTGHEDCTDFQQMALWLARQMNVLLEEEEWTVQEDVDKLREAVDDPNVAYGRIRDVLDKHNAVAIVILPEKLQLKWVRSFQELARKRMVFFAESSTDDPTMIINQFGRHPTCHRIFLPVGLLDGGGYDIRAILTKRRVSLGDAEMNELSEAVRPFKTPSRALEQLAIFFDDYGQSDITPAKLKAFSGKMMERLLAQLEKDKKS
ncbi:hypothetical protein [Nonomuraea insulae]|uniref:AAA+ ATPase domain-containing protein n=1 Tax=Nonomuraea insulae TaxID=1616787 RepID=A0ABW1D888_9ACTN